MNKFRNEIREECRMHMDEVIYGTLVGKPEVCKLWEDNIKMYVGSVIGWAGVDWIQVAQTRDLCRVLVNEVSNSLANYDKNKSRYVID
jgi:hypothetical protein